MNGATEFDDTTLMRYADGELDAETSAAIERALETDERLVSRVELFMETRRRAKAAFAPLLDEPVPDALAASVKALIDKQRSALDPGAGQVVAFPARPVRRPAPAWLLPIAASLVAAVVGGFVGYRMAGPAVESGFNFAAIQDRQFDSALFSVASGEQARIDAGTLRAIATFRDPSGALCREFEFDPAGGGTFVSVACRQDEAWKLTFSVAAQAEPTGYAPASSLETLDAYLSSVGAQPPLQPADEKTALAEARSTK